MSEQSFPPHAKKPAPAETGAGWRDTLRPDNPGMRSIRDRETNAPIRFKQPDRICP